MFRRPLFSIFFHIYRFCHPVLPSFKQYTCSTASFFQSFFLYTGSAILFYHLLNSIHVPPPPFSIFFSYIQVLPSCFTIFSTVYMFRRPFFQSFFLYTGSAILFYHLLSSIHVPPPSFFNLFFLYTGFAILFYHLLSSIHVPPPSFFNLFSYIQVLPSCFTIF